VGPQWAHDLADRLVLEGDPDPEKKGRLLDQACWAAWASPRDVIGWSFRGSEALADLFGLEKGGRGRAGRQTRSYPPRRRAGDCAEAGFGLEGGGGRIQAGGRTTE